MAGLRKRGIMWVARVQWRDANSQKKEKQIPLRTKSKVTARERLTAVNRVEADIKTGMVFSFPWMNDEGETKVLQLTLSGAVKTWLTNREKSKISYNTQIMNKLSLSYFIDALGGSRPLASITHSDIDRYVAFLEHRGNNDTTINIRLRTVKAMMNYYRRIDLLTKMPIIDQRKTAKKDPIYIADKDFQALMQLDQLDGFYKRVFLFYRETGMRLREPFIATLKGEWIDIPPETKTKVGRSIEVSEPLKKIFMELKGWQSAGNGATLKDPGEHLSKVFKRHFKLVSVNVNIHFHSLRHTFAVRRLLMGLPIYDVKLLLGHASVTTTEQYSNMNLKRVAQDFPGLAKPSASIPKMAMEDMVLEGMEDEPSDYLPEYEKIEA